jgi:hypothetical protein
LKSRCRAWRAGRGRRGSAGSRPRAAGCASAPRPAHRRAVVVEDSDAEGALARASGRSSGSRTRPAAATRRRRR